VARALRLGLATCSAALAARGLWLYLALTNAGERRDSRDGRQEDNRDRANWRPRASGYFGSGDKGAWSTVRSAQSAVLIRIAECATFTFVHYPGEWPRLMQTDSVRKPKSAEGWLRDQPASSTRRPGCASPLTGSSWPKTLSNDSPGGCENKAGLFHLQVEETAPVQLRLTECGHPSRSAPRNQIKTNLVSTVETRNEDHATVLFRPARRGRPSS
jgi:hypothetical protein